METLKKLSHGDPTNPAGEKIGPLAKSMYFLATVQVAWYYLRHVPSYMYLYRYENGADRMPFQGRVMMMFLLRWADNNRLCIALALVLKKYTPWVLFEITPESVLLVCLDTACILVTGIVALRIYRAASKERLLSLWIYPMVLALCTVEYILHTVQDLRYFYDLPSLMFFSVGLYLIYFRRHPALFAAWFLLGTVNRETTLMLLLFFLLARAVENGRVNWHSLRRPRAWAVVAPLAFAWLAWHEWIAWVFRANPTEFSWRFATNTGLLLFPLAWPQLFSIGCYTLPVLFIFRGSIQDPVLRAWLWTLPPWFAIMFGCGIFLETRIFGELTIYFACAVALIAEQTILHTLKQGGWSKRLGNRAVDDLEIAFAFRHEESHAFSNWQEAGLSLTEEEDSERPVAVDALQ